MAVDPEHHDPNIHDDKGEAQSRLRSFKASYLWDCDEEMETWPHEWILVAVRFVAEWDDDHDGETAEEQDAGRDWSINA